MSAKRSTTRTTGRVGAMRATPGAACSTGTTGAAAKSEREKNERFAREVLCREPYALDNFSTDLNAVWDGMHSFLGLRHDAWAVELEANIRDGYSVRVIEGAVTVVETSSRLSPAAALRDALLEAVSDD